MRKTNLSLASSSNHCNCSLLQKLWTCWTFLVDGQFKMCWRWFYAHFIQWLGSKDFVEACENLKKNQKLLGSKFHLNSFDLHTSNCFFTCKLKLIYGSRNSLQWRWDYIGWDYVTWQCRWCVTTRTVCSPLCCVFGHLCKCCRHCCFCPLMCFIYKLDLCNQAR